jgi:hypothetical protein
MFSYLDERRATSRSIKARTGLEKLTSNYEVCFGSDCSITIQAKTVKEQIEHFEMATCILNPNDFEFEDFKVFVHWAASWTDKSPEGLTALDEWAQTGDNYIGFEALEDLYMNINSDDVDKVREDRLHKMAWCPWVLDEEGNSSLTH